MRERLGIIGSGIAGMGCAHFLRQHYDLTLFEAGEHVGGHSNTVTVSENGTGVPIDTGFMVYNEVTYPLLTRLFKQLKVPTKDTSMSFSVQHRPSQVEWSGTDINTLFAQRRNLLNPRHWRFLLQLNRFNKEAVAALDEPQWTNLTLGDYVKLRRYGQDFLDRYLIPMSSAVWSTPPEKMLQFPARTLLRFWHNHGFLGLDTRHPWRTVDGGSQEYVKRLIEPFKDRIHTKSPVVSVRRQASEVEVVTSGDHASTHRFDRVILAAHADQSLYMLQDPTELETTLLRPFAYQANDVDLHSDPQFMPKTQLAWASWNYRCDTPKPPARSPHLRASTHYWMNNLQGVSPDKHYFVSLNTRSDIDANTIHKNLQYDHPLFDLPAIQAQARLPELNRPSPENRTFFCGSYFRYGFHEDAFKSAVDLCTQILNSDPW